MKSFKEGFGAASGLLIGMYVALIVVKYVDDKLHLLDESGSEKEETKTE